MAVITLLVCGRAAATDLNPRQVGMYVPDSMSRHWHLLDIAVSGTHAYVLCGDFNDSSQSMVQSLLILDVNDPGNPTLVGTYRITTPRFARSVSLSGNYAYVGTDGNGLLVIDVSSPSAPRRVGSYNTTEYPYGVVFAGNYGYICDALAGFVVVDMSDPVAPRRVGGFAGVGEIHQVVVSGNYAYLADRFGNGIQNEIQEFGALRILDINNPASPQLVASYPVEGQAWSVGLVGNIAYVGAAELELFDVADPANATHIESYGRTAWGGVLPGNRAYVSNYGLAILDISNLTSPRRLGGYPAWGVVSGRYGYVGIGGRGVAVVDFDPPANLPRVGGLDTPGYARGVAVAGTRAYVADKSAGLQVLDITQPTKPVLLGNYATSQPTEFVATSGNYAYLLETWHSGGGSYDSLLEIVDVSNPASPQAVGSYQTSGNTSSFAVSGHHAFLGLNNSPSGDHVEAIDLSTPGNPQQVGVYDNTVAMDFAVSGQQLFVANAGGLTILNISDPGNPQPVGSYVGVGLISHVTVSANRAYATGSSGFQVLDVTDPTQPSLLGVNTNFGSGWYGLAVSGNYAYGAAGGSGVQVADVSDPADPRLVGGNSAVVANDLVISGNHVFVAGEDTGGLQVFDLALSTPQSPPMLKVSLSGALLTVSWPASVTGAVLESTNQLSPEANWAAAPEAPVIVGDQNVVAIEAGQGSRFFRLKMQ